MMEGRASCLLEKLKEPDLLAAFPLAATVQVCDLPPPIRCSQLGFRNSKGDKDIGTAQDSVPQEACGSDGQHEGYDGASELLWCNLG